ncbi:MAG: LON peptidase substrate-binding domain-containing protein [Candidatus Sericytochromatia bacterium]|nr:LON peptidase substrate-binding domain-containing protein [Candidatus Sericytochromatia bacterium]
MTVPVPVVLPLFPLNLVLFPGVPLPLHIFEPRYRRMVENCLEKGQGFVVALTREDPDREDGAHDWATVASIEDSVRLDDGRYNILTLGQFRVRVLRQVEGAPYPQALVVPAPDPEPQVASAWLESLHATYREYAGLLGRFAAVPLPEVLPEDPAQATWVAAWALHVDHADKQRMLECPGVPERAEMVRRRMLEELSRLRDFAAALENNGYFFHRGMRFSRN